MRFEEVEHTADRALRIFGRDLVELFVNAAAGDGNTSFGQADIFLVQYDTSGVKK